MFDSTAEKLFYRHTISEPKYLDQEEIITELNRQLCETLRRPNIQSLFDQSYLQQVAANLLIPITGMKEEFIPNYNKLVQAVQSDIYDLFITSSYQKQFFAAKQETSLPKY